MNEVSINQRVRGVLARRPGHAHSHAEIYQGLRAGGIDVDAAKCAILTALRYLTGRGYISKVGNKATARFQDTGKPMENVRLPPGEAARRRRERSKLRARARAAARRPRPLDERRVDQNTVVRRPKKAVEAPAGGFETVEQFRARGGKVERLSASWDRAA